MVLHNCKTVLNDVTSDPAATSRSRFEDPLEVQGAACILTHEKEQQIKYL
jgi:hypothetical protein